MTNNKPTREELLLRVEFTCMTTSLTDAEGVFNSAENNSINNK